MDERTKLTGHDLLTRVINPKLFSIDYKKLGIENIDKITELINIGKGKQFKIRGQSKPKQWFTKLIKWKDDIFYFHSDDILRLEQVNDIFIHLINGLYLSILRSKNSYRDKWISVVQELVILIEDETKVGKIFERLLLQHEEFKKLNIMIDPLLLEKWNSNISINLINNYGDFSKILKIDDGVFSTKILSGSVLIELIHGSKKIQKKLDLNSDTNVNLPEEESFKLKVIVKSLLRKKYYSNSHIKIVHQKDVFSEQGKTNSDGVFSTKIFSGKMTIIASVKDKEHSQEISLDSDKVVKIHPTIL